jgi:hypothetical protein
MDACTACSRVGDQRARTREGAAVSTTPNFRMPKRGWPTPHPLGWPDRHVAGTSECASSAGCSEPADRAKRARNIAARVPGVSPRKARA